MDELIVFLAKERKVAPAGERELHTPLPARSVEKRWQHTLENLDEMDTQEEKNILKRNLQKMRTILSFGCMLFIITKGERMSTSP